jgi:hypothetical protein
VKQSVYYKKLSKFAFGVRFVHVLTQLEVRFNILVLRLRFARTLAGANNLVASGTVTVNSKLKNKNFLVANGDLICKAIKLVNTKNIVNSFEQRDPHIKFLFVRKKWRRKKKRVRYLWHIKRVLLMNYLLVNYKVRTAVLVRKPLMGEILLNRDKRLVSWQLIKKIYSLY